MVQFIIIVNQISFLDCICLFVNYIGGQCWLGIYCFSGVNYLVNCDFGKYCMQLGLIVLEGNCDVGYYCNVSSIRFDFLGNVCLVGYYCEVGLGIFIFCFVGIMFNIVGNINFSNCLQCILGNREKERKKEQGKEEKGK